LLAIAGGVHAASKPNVLFIAVDDLRPELGCYGSPVAITPNLDRLATDGLLFKRAYCQEAICRPSRASLMTGARPDTTGLTHNYVALRELRPDILTLPQHFIAHGYETVYLGKVFHPGDTDEEKSWSRKPVNGVPGIARPTGAYALPENRAIQRENMPRMLAKYGEAARRGLGSGPAYESADVPDHAYSDGYNTELAIATLKDMIRHGDRPFFLALEEAGVRDNTIIIVWGDHGWHLGDMGVWGKATNYEVATRVPLMIWTPDMPAGARGRTTDVLVELVDMYPTLCELARIPLPPHLEGHRGARR